MEKPYLFHVEVAFDSGIKIIDILLAKGNILHGGTEILERFTRRNGENGFFLLSEYSVYEVFPHGAFGRISNDNF
jgi:hypothetical protein